MGKSANIYVDYRTQLKMEGIALPFRCLPRWLLISIPHRGESGSLPVLRDDNGTTSQYDLDMLKLRSSSQYEVTVSAVDEYNSEGPPSSAVMYTRGGGVHQLSYKCELASCSIAIYWGQSSSIASWDIIHWLHTPRNTKIYYYQGGNMAEWNIHCQA